MAKIITYNRAKKLENSFYAQIYKKEGGKWNRWEIVKELKNHVEWGFKKALMKRGISVSGHFDAVMFWNAVLEEGLETWEKSNYAYYGLPLFRATALKYGFENEIGDDTGREDEYA